MTESLSIDLFSQPFQKLISQQRRQMALMQQGYPNALTAERIAKLNDVDFAWSVREEPVTSWNKKIAELKEYKVSLQYDEASPC